MASSAKRRRELARQRWERQQERRAVKSARKRRINIMGGIAVTAAAVIGGGVLVAGALGNDDDPSANPSASPSPSSSGPVDPAACEYRDTGDPAVEGIGLPREFKPDDKLPTSATMTINGDKVQIELASDAAPCTVRSLDFLASKDYFNDTTCHRLTTGNGLKVLQCGDPNGTGSGGPGYEFDNENTDGATYTAGTVAMANSGANTNGSQFFLVYGDSELPPDYTVFGKITKGLDTVEAIAKQGTKDGKDDGKPKKTVTLEEVTTS